jgi:cysteine desulfuration protein SufE
LIDSIYKKIENLLIISSYSPTEKYEWLIQKGKELQPFPMEKCLKENQVSGCQSIVYLYSQFQEEKIYFFAYSEALISAGLAAVLIDVYSGQLPETILKNPPEFLEKMGFSQALTPGRFNGVFSMYQHMKRKALLYLIPNLTTSYTETS